MSCLIALLFALHPVQTEAVTYASGRSTSLAALLALGSIVAWFEGRERGARSCAYVISPALFACSLATKETTLVVPGVLLLLAATDPRRPSLRDEALRIASFHGPVLIAAAGLAAASSVYRGLLATSLHLRDVPTNLRTQANGMFWLAGQLVRVDRLCADPGLPVLTS